jgi:DNA repair protein RecO (recombination protein O)
MEWHDEGVLVAVRPHGESAAIIEVFTEGHGRHAGVVRGGASRRMAPVLQPGAQLTVAWRARLDAHIGAYTVEPLAQRAGLMADRTALMGLNAVCALLRFALPERDPHPALYRATAGLLDAMAAGRPWARDYLAWELLLLADLGFGLDLETCAVTGAREGLAFVSPRSGRAVSRAGAGDWAPRLLPLPDCLADPAAGDAAGLPDAFRTTGHFLAAHLAAALGDRPLPEARARLVAALARAAAPGA